MFPNGVIKHERASSIVGDKASVEDLQRYVPLVDRNCLFLMMFCPVLILSVKNTNLFWTLIVKQFVTVLFNLPDIVSQLQWLMSKLLNVSALVEIPTFLAPSMENLWLPLCWSQPKSKRKLNSSIKQKQDDLNDSKRYLL